MSVIKCAFCKGTGKNPLNLLPKFAICQVCMGKGEVEVKDPAIKCVYCKGTGVLPYNDRISCNVCSGKGMIAVKGRF